MPCCDQREKKWEGIKITDCAVFTDSIILVRQWCMCVFTLAICICKLHSIRIPPVSRFDQTHADHVHVPCICIPCHVYSQYYHYICMGNDPYGRGHVITQIYGELVCHFVDPNSTWPFSTRVKSMTSFYNRLCL